MGWPTAGGARNTKGCPSHATALISHRPGIGRASSVLHFASEAAGLEQSSETVSRRGEKRSGNRGSAQLFLEEICQREPRSSCCEGPRRTTPGSTCYASQVSGSRIGIHAFFVIWSVLDIEVALLCGVTTQPPLR